MDKYMDAKRYVTYDKTFNSWSISWMNMIVVMLPFCFVFFFTDSSIIIRVDSIGEENKVFYEYYVISCLFVYFYYFFSTWYYLHKQIHALYTWSQFATLINTGEKQQKQRTLYANVHPTSKDKCHVGS